jgi:hypothetical protein
MSLTEKERLSEQRRRKIRGYQTYQELGLPDYWEAEPADDSEAAERAESIAELTARFRREKGHVPVGDAEERRLRLLSHSLSGDCCEV